MGSVAYGVVFLEHWTINARKLTVMKRQRGGAGAGNGNGLGERCPHIIALPCPITKKDGSALLFKTPRGRGPSIGPYEGISQRIAPKPIPEPPSQDPPGGVHTQNRTPRREGSSELKNSLTTGHYSKISLFQSIVEHRRFGAWRQNTTQHQGGTLAKARVQKKGSWGRRAFAIKIAQGSPSLCFSRSANKGNCVHPKNGTPDSEWDREFWWAKRSFRCVVGGASHSVGPDFLVQIC